MNKDNFLINQLTIEHLELKKNDQVLEIGMGNGFFVKDIFKAYPSFHYTGCDVSETMVLEAARLNEPLIRNGSANFVLSTAESLPFQMATFDKVFSVHTIYFWETPSRVLAEIHRVLKPGGELTIVIRPKSFMEEYPYTEFGFSLFDSTSLVGLLNDHNFLISKVVEKEEYTKVMNGVNVSVQALLVSGMKS